MKALPKPVIVIALLVLATGAYWYLGRVTEPARWLGYVEAETEFIAAPVAGRLAQRSVERGAAVGAGTPLFLLDPETTDAETARLEAQVAAARAQEVDLADARARAPELAAARAAQAAAQAQLTRAEADFTRIEALAHSGFASRSQLDAARAARDGARAGLAQGRAQTASLELSAGRQGQIAAAAANRGGAEAALRGQRQRRRDIAPVAPEAGVVEQTFYNPGEWVPANVPVIALLPDARRKLRFYVPQERIAALRPGMAVRFTCDGCGPAREARISYIAPRAEFTPPVVYSERARAKFVFMVEALLPPSARPLSPGLPVEVTAR